MRKLKHHEIPRVAPEALTSLKRHPIVVIVDNVRSLHNVGSLFRTADACALEAIILTGITPTPEHPGIHKTALGAQDFVPWKYIPDPAEAAQYVKKQGYTLAALELTDTPTYIEELQAEHFPLALIIGHEVHGVRDDVLEQADLALEIPQYGAKQSLNVAVAFGIAAHNLVQHWRKLQEP